ncbi:P-type conjugative transfer protein TrbJ [Novosphingobium sp. PhB55]|nr:P-type conjugative transfer protein TrbJ [Novosphingobium sp. PhB55]TDW59984.1 P-type conjugative transfer protein TrbJ [Novosphingobium sp. PhB55]
MSIMPVIRGRRAGALIILAGCALAAGAALQPRSVQAVVVYDPTNYSQNVLTAARALMQVNNQIQSLQNQAQGLVNQAKNLSRVSFPELQALTDTLRKIDVLMDQARGIEFKVANADRQFAQLYPDAFTRSLTLDDQVTAARTRMAAQVSAYRQTVTLQAQIAENVAVDTSALGSLVARSQGAEGALQVQQATNQLLALTAKQQFQIQEMMAAQYRAEAVSESNRAQEAAEAQAATQKFLGSGTAYTPN